MTSKYISFPSMLVFNPQLNALVSWTVCSAPCPATCPAAPALIPRIHLGAPSGLITNHVQPPVSRSLATTSQLGLSLCNDLRSNPSMFILHLYYVCSPYELISQPTAHTWYLLVLLTFLPPCHVPPPPHTSMDTFQGLYHTKRYVLYVSRHCW